MGTKILSIFLSCTLLAGGIGLPGNAGGTANILQEEAGMEVDEKSSTGQTNKEQKEKFDSKNTKSGEQENTEPVKKQKNSKTLENDSQKQETDRKENAQKSQQGQEIKITEEKMDALSQEEPKTETNGIKNHEKAGAKEVVKAEQKDTAMLSSKSPEIYQSTNGYFFIYVRKQGESLDQGHWHIIDMSVGKPSAEKQQKITWEMVYLGKMPKKYATKVNEWILVNWRKPSTERDNYSLELEKNTSWEKTRHDGYGTNPVFDEAAPGISEMPGFPHAARYYMLCGKFKYKVLGYRMYFDNSVFKDMSGMDIEKENKQIQKKDEKLKKGEDPWTGDDYFKFSIDTNNVGMTNYGSSGEYHHSIYGFILKPNTYTVKYDANGGTGKMSSQSATYDEEFRLTGNKFKREGYVFDGWNVVKTGGTFVSSYNDKQKVKNLTAVHKGTVTLYAQWKPNTLNVKYNANGGVASQFAPLWIETFSNNWNYETSASTPEKSTSFGLSKTGHSIKDGAEWNTKPDGTGISFDQDAKYAMTDYAPDLKGGNKEVVLYAQWRPNTLSVKYNANGGDISGKPSLAITTFSNNWNYLTTASAPEKFTSFGLSKTGYERNAGKEWNTKADGTGLSFSQDAKYAMTSYAPDLANGDRTATLYAQWKPKIFSVTLDNRLTNPSAAGTKTIYEKYDNGWYLDQSCTSILKNKNRAGKITVPGKAGYIFQGYYTSATGGTQMINANGSMTEAGIANYKLASNATWHAHYKYQISCEDYADIPCDFEKTDGDIREEIGALISYNPKTGQTEVKTGQTGITATLLGQPVGTKVGQFQSTLAGQNASAASGNAQSALLLFTPQEGAAYQLTVTAGGKTLCSRIVYFKGGRFRTSVQLAAKGIKEAEHGASMAGSLWGTSEPSYYLYRYIGCTEFRNIQEPGTVYRYFTYKDVNMAYSGNGATSGTNILEQDVSLEDAYQFRDNGFSKTTTEEKKTEDGKKYQCSVKYGFDGWAMSKITSYQEKEQKKMNKVYQTAYDGNTISTKTTESIDTYQKAEPVSRGSILNLFGKEKGTSKKDAGIMPSEYINLLAKWNAFPTIVVAPGEKLEFYEGEDVGKKDLINHLIAHDHEDNNQSNRPYIPDLNEKLRIVKISYPESANKSQKAYEKTYAKDVTDDFLLDTYYLKLEKDETVDILVTFAVTDSNGQTTEETFPVKVKYNNYPEISSDDIFYYFKEEANRGEITADALTGRATAEDVEDGDISSKISLKDFDPQAVKMQTESKTEFTITYQVTDAYKKTTYKNVALLVWDEDAAIAEMPKYYVRYISEKYLNTLEANSAWRNPENLAYLKEILDNETPMEIWKFTHEDVAAVQDWITKDGEGNWKIGQQANQEFLKKFSYCKQ